jgi:hypothetical protein
MNLVYRIGVLACGSNTVPLEPLVYLGSIEEFLSCTEVVRVRLNVRTGDISTGSMLLPLVRQELCQALLLQECRPDFREIRLDCESSIRHIEGLVVATKGRTLLTLFFFSLGQFDVTKIPVIA